MYLDDDANIAAPLNTVVMPSDRFLVGKEAYDYDDRYIVHYINKYKNILSVFLVVRSLS